MVYTPPTPPSPPATPSTYSKFLEFMATWTPRTFVGALAGYYSLGIAYEKGVMAAIDRVAIRVLKNSVGYAGIGKFMPSVQWYAAWGVRITATLGATILYDLTERIVYAVARFIFSKKQSNLPLKSPLNPSINPVNLPSKSPPNLPKK